MAVTIVDLSTGMNVEALRQAIRVLNEVEAAGRPFEMLSWVKSFQGSLQDNPVGPARCAGGELDCGTASCAVGWCARDRWFNERGFHLWQFPPAIANDVAQFEPVIVDDVGIVATGWRACAMMFGLTEAQAIFLFSHVSYNTEGIHTITPRHVIARIKTVMFGNASVTTRSRVIGAGNAETEPAHRERVLETV